MTSGPPVIASSPLPVPNLLFQPRPCSSIGAASGAGEAFVRQPLAFGAPRDALVGLPDILAPAAKTERLEAHRLEGDVAGEDHKVGPGDFPTVFLLDRPQQPARLVEARVVRPAV